MTGFSFIENGSTTSVPGFKAAGVTAGFKRSGAPDFALLYSEVPADAAGVFTTCLFAAAPVRYCKALLAKGTKLQAVSINSGIASKNANWQKFVSINLYICSWKTKFVTNTTTMHHLAIEEEWLRKQLVAK